VSTPTAERTRYAVEAIADWVVRSDTTNMGASTPMLMRRNVLDSLGCAIAALGSEMAHSAPDTRVVATEGFLKLVDILAGEWKESPPEVAQSRAMAAAATMIGALMLSRVVTEPELSSAVLKSAADDLTSRHA